MRNVAFHWRFHNSHLNWAQREIRSETIIPNSFFFSLLIRLSLTLIFILFSNVTATNVSLLFALWDNYCETKQNCNSFSSNIFYFSLILSVSIQRCIVCIICYIRFRHKSKEIANISSGKLSTYSFCQYK